MALTYIRDKIDVVGSLHLHIFTCTFTSVTGGVVPTGMGNALFASFQPETSDDHGNVFCNYSDAGSTAKRGDVYIDGVTSNDVGKLMVLGV